MADTETALALDQDLPAVEAAVGDAGARLKRDPVDEGLFWLILSPPGAPEEEFFARIAWHSYPHAPPSVKFATGVGGSVDQTTAWPQIPGYRPASFDICQPFTAEGHAVHPDWAHGPESWPTNGNPFLWVVGILIADMKNRYQGRSG